MSSFGLAMRQVAFENRAFWRNPASAFFTVILPLLFLVLFNAIFGDNTIMVDGKPANTSVFYVPAIAALSAISACFTNNGMTVTIARDLGVLKRMRGTPLPAWAFIFGRVVHSIFIAALLVAIVTIAGQVLYGVDAPTETLGAYVLTVAIAAPAFCALGLAVTAIIPNSDAAPAVVNGVILPLLFISDVFIPPQNTPEWLDVVANIFPVLHFSEALQSAYNPFETGTGFEWVNLAVIAAWGILGTLLALRFFTWEPRR
jgi:ABC-2 type transport system permease protein